MMDVIFASDALQPPLTGIGRYSFELARRLQVSPEIARLRFFALGQWETDPLQRLEQELGAAAQEEAAPRVAGGMAGGVAAVPQRSALQRLRGDLAGRRWAVRAYNRVAPLVFGWRLRGNAGALFHAPNYFAPPFAGRTVATVHDLSHLRFPQFHPAARVDLLNRALPASLARTDHVITVSEATRQEFLALFPQWPPERVSATLLAADAVFKPWPQEVVAQSLQQLNQQLHQGLDGARGQPSGGAGMPTRARAPLRAGGYCLYVGTVEPRKNLDRLLDAYARLPADVREAYPLVVAGGRGWNSEHTHARMRQAQQQGWLVYLSFVPQRQLPHLYAGAALVVYPSLYEGFGLPVVEAMASGVPVLTSALSSMPEVAGGAAMLVDPLDVDAIAQGIVDGLGDARWRAQARSLGLARAAQLSWERCTRETIAAYARALA